MLIYLFSSPDTNVMYSPQYFDAQQQQQQVTITYPYSSPSLVQQTVSIDNTFKESESSNILGFYAKFYSLEFILITLPCIQICELN